MYGQVSGDIWAGIIAEGGLAAMTILIGKLQEVDPLLLAVVTFVVFVIVSRVIYHLQEKKLKKRLNIERGRWNKIREERIKLRQQYLDRRTYEKSMLRASDVFNQDGH